MRIRFFALAALALSLAACTQDELAGDKRLPEGEYPVVIRATGLSVEATPLAAPSHSCCCGRRLAGRHFRGT